MNNLTNKELVEANRDRLHAWAREGKSYFWMAKQIGLGNRSVSVISKWFLSQGIRRKTANYPKPEVQA